MGAFFMEALFFSSERNQKTILGGVVNWAPPFPSSCAAFTNFHHHHHILCTNSSSRMEYGTLDSIFTSRRVLNSLTCSPHSITLVVRYYNMRCPFFFSTPPTQATPRNPLGQGFTQTTVHPNFSHSKMLKD